MRLLLNFIALALVSSAVLAAPLPHNAQIEHTAYETRTHRHNPAYRHQQCLGKTFSSHNHIARSLVFDNLEDDFERRGAVWDKARKYYAILKDGVKKADTLLNRREGLPEPPSDIQARYDLYAIDGLDERSFSLDDLDDVERRALRDKLRAPARFRFVKTGVNTANKPLNGREVEEDLETRGKTWNDVMQVGHDVEGKMKDFGQTVAQKFKDGVKSFDTSINGPPAPPPSPAAVQARYDAYSINERALSLDDLDDVERRALWEKLKAGFQVVKKGVHTANQLLNLNGREVEEDLETRGKTWDDVKQVGADVGGKIKNFGQTVEQKFKDGVHKFDTAVNGQQA